MAWQPGVSVLSSAGMTWQAAHVMKTKKGRFAHVERRPPSPYLPFSKSGIGWTVCGLQIDGTWAIVKRSPSLVCKSCDRMKDAVNHYRSGGST